MSSRGLWWAVACQLGLSLGYLFLTPAFEAPDEPEHLRYAYHLSHTGELPILNGTADSLGRPPEDEATQAYHPPGYYGLLALTMHATGHWDTAPALQSNPSWADWAGYERGDVTGIHMNYVHGFDERSPVSPELRLFWMLRMWSVLFGLAAVLATWKLGRLAFPSRPVIADLGAVLMACLPKWAYMHGMINNGIPASALAHLVVLVLAVALVRRRLTLGAGLLVGLLSGMAVMSKLTALFLLPIMFSVYVWGVVRWADRRKQIVASSALALGALAAVCAGFFLRNHALYGDFMALEAHQLSFPTRIRVPPDQVGIWIREYFFPQVFSSMLGHLGWWVLPPLGWLIVTGKVLAALAGFGLVLRVLGRRKDVAQGVTEREANPAVVVLLAAVALVVFGVTFRYNFLMRGPHARYLFPAMGPMAILFAAGLVALGDRLEVGLGKLKPLAFAVPAAISLYVLLFQFRPLFQPELAPGDAHHASLMAGMATPPAEPTMTLLAPADGSASVDPPEFCWTLPGSAPDDALYSIQVYRENGRIFLATYEYFWAEITGDCFQLPQRAWAYVPIGEEVLWKVRRIPNRERGETMDDVEGSAPFRLTRLAPVAEDG